MLRDIATESHAVVYAREIQRIRSELFQLCEISDLVGLEAVFATSGTDVHLIVAQYTGSGEHIPALVVMVEANETGSGVAAALAGRHFNAAGPQNTVVVEGMRIAGSSALEVMSVPIRLADGTLRQLAEIDNQVESLVNEAVALGRRVLLILVDQSKTGLIAPSPACISRLHYQFPDSVDVLVDACQFRIAPPTLRAYLEQGFMVALTGSKFVAGPSFSAVVLLPFAAAQWLRQRKFPPALLPYSSRGNWPTDWNTANELNNDANFGLLLRWEAALEEMRKFHSIPQAAIINFLQAFAHAIRRRLTSDPAFEPLPVPQLDRHPLIEANSWDHLQTIFSFLLYHPETHSETKAGRLPLSREETLHVYKQLQTGLTENPTFNRTDSGGGIASLRCQLGQPVACGNRNGIEVSALRICVSARLIIEAASQHGKGATAVIEDALAALNKAAWITENL
ncbi:MAG: hypothetical protein PHD65_03210 [Gallionella sp.]|nr:hypothetical protein [Gallionella sp.]